MTQKGFKAGIFFYAAIRNITTLKITHGSMAYSYSLRILSIHLVLTSGYWSI